MMWSYLRVLFLAGVQLLMSQRVDVTVRFADRIAPNVGKGMKVETVVTSESRRILPVKLFVVRDGVPFEISPKLEAEEDLGLVYTALLPAPVQELVVISYVIFENGRVARSKPAVFRRKCVEKGKLEPAIESLERISPKDLVSLNEGLVLDNDIYSNLIKQIETIVRLFEK